MEARAITPVAHPIRGTVKLPGSKSITNRALILAALADGETTLHNSLFADDTQRMVDCLRALGFTVDADISAETITVQGLGGTILATRGDLFVGNSGTTARFILPLAALGQGDFTMDGVARMRERPIADLLGALRTFGTIIESANGNDRMPLYISAHCLHGGAATIRSDKSSQFLSGLLMALPVADTEQTVLHLEGEILSAPYIEMTVQMVRDFGGIINVGDGGRTFTIPGRQTYSAHEKYPVEPDASAASYFFAIAALTNGSVRVENVGDTPLQGDWAFVEILERMGCTVLKGNDFIEVIGTNQLHGICADMNAISDTVMTLAAIAPFADSPTVIENVAHIREKETDRLAAIAVELKRLGVTVEERNDGLTIYPTEKIQPATVQTYDDHRMAMAFALVGLRAQGITIADPDCVAKTFPGYWRTLDGLVAESTERMRE